jgi:hypothetical protein
MTEPVSFDWRRVRWDTADHPDCAHCRAAIKPDAWWFKNSRGEMARLCYACWCGSMDHPEHLPDDFLTEELFLSVRSARCLQKNGITTVGKLRRITDAELLCMKNFGKLSLNEVRSFVAYKP